MASGVASTRWSITPDRPDAQFKKMSEDQFDRVIDVNPNL
jgi:hypothetical protein